MDDFGFGGERPRQRFIERATQAGFHASLARWQPDLVSYSLSTLALVWPEAAYTFYQVIVRGRQVQEVATEKKVDVRTIHRQLAGYASKAGAEDWFLIILELYREADFIHPSGAEAVYSCFLPVWKDARILRAFFLMLMEAAGNCDQRTILDSVPWRSTAANTVLAWPCYGEKPPLEHSLLPGVVAALQGAQDIQNRLHWALLTSLFSKNEPYVWKELLAILNTGGCRNVAARGRIPEEHLAQAEASACLLLSDRSKLGPQAAMVRYGVLGMLALTPLAWDRLNTYVADGTLHQLLATVRLPYCSQHYFELPV